MGYVNIIDNNNSVHCGVFRARYIGDPREFLTILQKTKLSAEILVENAQKKFDANFANRTHAGQHETGQLDVRSSPSDHAYDIRGRLFMQET